MDTPRYYLVLAIVTTDGLVNTHKYPVLGETQDELLKDRQSCEEIGHPEQAQLLMLAGASSVECALCGETPDFQLSESGRT